MPKNHSYASSASVLNRAEDLTDHLRGLVELGHHRMAEVRDKAVEAKEAMAEKADSLFTTMAKTIKAHPAAAAGIALGIGFFAMRLIRR